MLVGASKVTFMFAIRGELWEREKQILFFFFFYIKCKGVFSSLRTESCQYINISERILHHLIFMSGSV